MTSGEESKSLNGLAGLALGLRFKSPATSARPRLPRFSLTTPFEALHQTIWSKRWRPVFNRIFTLFCDQIRNCGRRN